MYTENLEIVSKFLFYVEFFYIYFFLYLEE